MNQGSKNEFPHAREYDSETDVSQRWLLWLEREYQVNEGGWMCPKGQHCTVAIAHYDFSPLG